jgi:O-antigen/teichoic acid export membrane protein
MNSDDARVAVKSSISRTALAFVGMAITFFMTPFMIRKLGDSWFGVLTLVNTLTGYYYFIDFGLATAVSRFVTLYVTKKDHHNTNVIINTSLMIYLGMAFALCVITIAIASLAGVFVADRSILLTVRIVIIIFGIDLAMEFPFKAFAGIITAYMRYDLLSLSHFGTLLLNTALTVTLLNAGYGIVGIAVIAFFCSQISNIIFYSISKHIYPEMRLSRLYWKRDRIRDLFGYSIWSFVIHLGEMLRFRVDSFVIGGALTVSHVTHFSIGSNLANYLVGLIYRATNFLTPLFTKYHAEENYFEIRHKLLLVTKINAILAFFGGGLVLMVGKAFISRWVGDRYLDAYPVLVVLTCAVILEATQYPSNNVLMAIAKHRYFAIVNIAEGICNLVLSIILVRYLGMLGVALGTLIPLVITRLFIMPFYLAKCVGLQLGKYYSIILGVAGATALYLFAFQLAAKDFIVVPHYAYIVLSCLAAVPAYLVIVFLLFLDASEKVLLRRFFPIFRGV